MKIENAVQAAGYLTGVLLVIAIFIWLIPWVTINSINGIFGTDVEHSLRNYFYTWVLFIFWRGPLALGAKK